MTPPPTVAELQRIAAVRSLVVLERIGWQVTSVEIDLHAVTARIELRSGPRLVTFDARNGTVTTTREIIGVEMVPTGRRGDRFIAERLRTQLIGRERHLGIRSGLRWLADYVQQNAAPAALPGEARSAFRALLDSATGGRGS